jgi:tight adherence protein C
MDIAAFVTDPNNLISGFVGVLSFATVVTLAGPMMNRNSLATRMKSVANRREELRRRSRQALTAKTASGRLRHADEGLSKTGSSCPSCSKTPRWWTSWPRPVSAVPSR